MEKHESNPALDKEKAEGSRETVNEALEQREGAGGGKQGTSNRSAEEEAREQDELPPRGQRKGQVSA
jgi:hypothetical protein